VAAERYNQYLAAEAALTSSRAAVTTAEANLRVEQARQAEAKADADSAAARRKVAEADREQARILLEYAQVRTPFAGVITRRLVDTGEFVQSAASGKPDPLFTVVRVDRVRIIADIPEADTALVQVGQPAALRGRAAARSSGGGPLR
jgi:multidrug resistance efflux pump